MYDRIFSKSIIWFYSSLRGMKHTGKGMKIFRKGFMLNNGLYLYLIKIRGL
jgi:hypothetical protein